MAILTTDVDVYGSGGTGETDSDLWFGGVRSNTELAPAVAEENLYANVDGTEAAAGSQKYRGLYFRNGHASITLEATTIWISTQTASSETDVKIALAGEGLNNTIEIIANEDAAPSGETFTAPATKGGGLVMGDVPTLQHFGFWTERNVDAAASAFDNDDWALTIEGDTIAA